MKRYLYRITATSFFVLLLIIINTYSKSFDIQCLHILEPVTAPIGSPYINSQPHELNYIQTYPILFIGDSRTVGMKQALTYRGYDLSNQSFLAEIGKGYSWFTGQSSSLTILSDSPHIVVINLGVNDLGNCTKYQQLYESYLDTYWHDCPVYIVSVNPVCSPCQTVNNFQIESFNQSMQDWIMTKNAQSNDRAFSIQYIDTYTTLQQSGFASSDGLHYSASTYETIYQQILTSIEEPIGDGIGIFQ